MCLPKLNIKDHGFILGGLGTLIGICGLIGLFFAQNAEVTIQTVFFTLIVFIALFIMLQGTVFIELWKLQNNK